MQSHRQPFSALDNAPELEASPTGSPFKHFDYSSEGENERDTPSPVKQLGKGITPSSLQRDAQAVLDALNSSESPPRASVHGSDYDFPGSPFAGSLSLQGFGEDEEEEEEDKEVASHPIADDQLDGTTAEATTSIIPLQTQHAGEPEQNQDISNERLLNTSVDSSGQRLSQFLKEQLEDRDTDLHTKELELAELHSLVADKDAEIAELRTENNTLNVELSQSQAALREARRAADDARSVAEATMSENQNLRADLRATRELIKQHEAALSYSQRDVDDIQNQADMEAEHLRLKVADLEEQLAAALHQQQHHQNQQHLLTPTAAGAGAALADATPYHTANKDFEDLQDGTKNDQSHITATVTATEIEIHNKNQHIVSTIAGGVNDSPRSQISDVFASLGIQMHDEHDEEDDAASERTVSEAAAAVRHVAEVQREEQRKRRTVDDVTDWFDRQAEDADQKKQLLYENKLLKSEVETMERKCEQTNESLIKANHAMRVLHHKLQRERNTIATLKEEKCMLQSQVLAAQHALQDRSTVDPGQMEALLHELAASQRRAEGLLQEKAALMEKLELLTEVQDDKKADNAAALQQATEALEAEQARVAALESDLREASLQLGSLRTSHQRLESVNMSLQAVESRAAQLATALDEERGNAANAAAEITALNESVVSSASELMSLREVLQEERSIRERVSQENAALQGRVESLDAALSRLERSEGDLSTCLARDKAELQGELRRAEEQVNAAMSACALAREELQAEKESRRSLETALEGLRQDLHTSNQKVVQLQSAITLAAQQLRYLGDSHTSLEQELTVTNGQLEASRREAAALQHSKEELTAALEWSKTREHELSRLIADTESSRETLVNELESTLSALDQSEEERCALDTAITALEHDKNALAAELAAAESKIRQQKDSMSALRAECDAMSKLGARVEDTNRELVDNMCDMSGLIDAVAALQQQTGLLQEKLAAAEARAHEAEAARDGTAFENSALAEELQVQNTQRAELQVAVEQLQMACGQAESLLAAGTQKYQELTAQLEALKEEREVLVSRCLHAEAAAAASGKAQSKLDGLQTEFSSLLTQKEVWLKECKDLREQLEAKDKALVLAEGKLVLARQREGAFKEASRQLKVFHAEISAHLGESEDYRRGREAAEDRCAELLTRCLDLGERKCEAEDRAKQAELALTAKEAECAKLSEELSAATLNAARLEEQAAAFHSLRDRLGSLEDERKESTAWLQGAAAELASKSDESAALRTKLEAAEDKLATESTRAQNALTQLAASEVAASQAQQAAADWERSLAAARTELAVLRGDLGSAKERLAVALERERETGVEAVELREQYDAVQAAFDEAQRDLEASQAYAADLEAQAAATAARLEEAKAAASTGVQTCNILTAKLEALSGEHTRVAAATESLKKALTKEENKSSELAAQLEQRSASLQALQSDRDALHAEAAASSRAAELLQSQCDVLRQQLEFLQNQRSDEGEGGSTSAALRGLLTSSQEEQERLRARLAQAAGELAIAQDARVAAEAQLSELSAALRRAEAEAAEAERRANQAINEASSTRSQLSNGQERRLNLERQLELAESLKEQLQKDVESLKYDVSLAQKCAVEAAERASEAQQRAVTMESEYVAVVQQAAAQFEQQTQAVERLASALIEISGGCTAGDIEEVVLDIEALKAEHIKLWGPLGNAITSGLPSAAALSQQQEALLNRLASVQAVALRLAGDKHAEQVSVEANWQLEKKAMKAVCKLALAVTMDRVAAGAGDISSATAADVARELEPTVSDLGDTMSHLGLDRVWHSLNHLANTASNSHKQAAALAAELADENSRLLAKCADLQAGAEHLQGLVARWEGRGAGMEQSMHSVMTQLDDATSAVRWTVGDFASSTSSTMEGLQHGPGSQLEAAAHDLVTAVRGLCRRYKTLTRHISLEALPDKFSSDLKLANTAAEDGRKVILRAGRKAGAEALAAEAGRKAHGIADKLQSMLTPIASTTKPQSRAIQHSGSKRMNNNNNRIGSAAAASCLDVCSNASSSPLTSIRAGFYPEDEEDGLNLSQCVDEDDGNNAHQIRAVQQIGSERWIPSLCNDVTNHDDDDTGEDAEEDVPLRVRYGGGNTGRSFLVTLG